MYDTEDEEEELPEWVNEERDDFNNVRDKNGDGVLDREEVLEWVYPAEEQNYAEEEAKHLIKNADSDSDRVRKAGILSFCVWELKPE